MTRVAILALPLLLGGCLTTPLDILWGLSAGDALVSGAIEYSDTEAASKPVGEPGQRPGHKAP